MFDNMTTVSQGSVGLGSAIAYFTAHGYVVSIPLNDNQGYDLIVDKDNHLQRVQVKTTGAKTRGSRTYTVQLKSVHARKSSKNVIRRFTADRADLLYVLVADGTKYLIPAQLADGKTSMSLGSVVEKYKLP